MIKKIASLDKIDTIVDILLKEVPKNAILFLRGDLASGKTTLTKSIVEKKGGDIASSPTFSLQQTYSKELFHYDFYRIDNQELNRLGIIEEFEKEGWHIIEWGSKELEEFLFSIGYNIVNIDIKIVENSREYTLKF